MQLKKYAPALEVQNKEIEIRFPQNPTSIYVNFFSIFLILFNIFPQKFSGQLKKYPVYA